MLPRFTHLQFTSKTPTLEMRQVFSSLFQSYAFLFEIIEKAIETKDWKENLSQGT